MLDHPSQVNLIGEDGLFGGRVGAVSRAWIGGFLRRRAGSAPGWTGWGGARRWWASQRSGVRRSGAARRLCPRFTAMPPSSAGNRLTPGRRRPTPGKPRRRGAISMGRLQHTEGLTEDQRDILAAVREFVDEQIIPVATDLEHKDEYPTAIVEGMKEMGVFGLMIPEEYGGLGQSMLTYALVVEEIARGWMSVSGIINTHFIVAYMLIQHGTDEQKKTFLPRMAAG